MTKYEAKTGEIFNSKAEAVKYALRTNKDNAKWYREQHNITEEWLDNLTEYNANYYGENAAGDICDSILVDADIFEAKG